ncbi:DUF4340 domain-containing protein [Granulosicoccus sp.]|nr:hypothetical protein [Granulosicoccus sp.]MDB4222449.1 DUF4340 domain-containing protein [Granulosicoccus sp.]
MTTREMAIKRWIVIASCTLMVLIAAIATLLWYESKQRELIHNKQLDKQNSLRTLVIKRPGKANIKIRANDDKWLIHEPCTVAVNQTRLQPLLSIVPPAAFSYAAAQVDLEAAGLINPLATVIVNDVRIDIGNTDLSGERRYIKRGERVEFIPEWILPLLNGGLSALSTLELFEEVITSVTIDEPGEMPSNISQSLETWQQLTAQQIVPWPLTDNAELSVEAPAQAQHSVTIKSESDEKRLQVFTTAAFAAVVFEGARCAFLLSNDALSTSSQ